MGFPTKNELKINWLHLIWFLFNLSSAEYYNNNEKCCTSIVHTDRITVHGTSNRLHASYQLSGLDNNFSYLILKQRIKQTNRKKEIRLNIGGKHCANCISSSYGIRCPEVYACSTVTHIGNQIRVVLIVHLCKFLALKYYDILEVLKNNVLLSTS